jgi:hypothetical protein
MREASPTGGALGQVPFQQQQRLEQMLGSLQIDQDPHVLQDNIKRFINTYNDIIHGEGEGPKRFELSFDEDGKTRPGHSTGNFAPKSRGFQPGQRQQQAIPAQPMPDITPEMRRGALEELARRRQMAGQRGGR